MTDNIDIASSRSPRVVDVAAVAAGNAVECYDFLIYSTFALFIGNAYFSAHSPAARLLLSLATFGIGFVTRPIGAIVLGRLSDRVGRKPAMLTSFGLMAVGLLAVGVTPGYHEIGVAAPIIVVVSRLVQGFALGGEIGPSTAYLIEIADADRRGTTGSLQGASQAFSGLLAAGVGLILTIILGHAALASWGWRVAFLLGLTIVPFGLIIRSRLPETITYPDGKSDRQSESTPIFDTPPIGWRLVIASTGLLASLTMSVYVGAYMTTYALDTLHLPAQAAFGMSICTGVCGVIFTPVGGWLSDKIGRRPVILAALLATALVVLPAYSVMLSATTAITRYVAVAAVGIPVAIAGGPALVAITESFPRARRSLALGTIYALAITIFGGSTQVVVAALTHATGESLMPGIYRLAATLVGLAAVIVLPESAPVKMEWRSGGVSQKLL